MYVVVAPLRFLGPKVFVVYKPVFYAVMSKKNAHAVAFLRIYANLIGRDVSYGTEFTKWRVPLFVFLATCDCCDFFAAAPTHYFRLAN